MPSKPLFDLDSIDLTRILATPDQLKQKLAQRGTFEMLDAAVHRDEEAGIIVGYKEIRGDDWWAPDHIPGRPLFPGALMIETAAQLCSYDYSMRAAEGDDRFVGFGGLNGTRFRGVVEPEGRMHFVAQVKRIRKSMFIYQTQGYYRDKMVFETEVVGVVL
jgi:3-hydroxyacyl-[acyl-carrier-protein] dehydratase